MGWLFDTDVICQDMKKNGDPKAIAWLEAEQDCCYASATVIADLAALCLREARPALADTPGCRLVVIAAPSPGPARLP